MKSSKTIFLNDIELKKIMFCEAAVRLRLISGVHHEPLLNYVCVGALLVPALGNNARYPNFHNLKIEISQSNNVPYETCEDVMCAISN